MNNGAPHESWRPFGHVSIRIRRISGYPLLPVVPQPVRNTPQVCQGARNPSGYIQPPWAGLLRRSRKTDCEKLIRGLLLDSQDQLSDWSIPIAARTHDIFDVPAIHDNVTGAILHTGFDSILDRLSYSTVHTLPTATRKSNPEQEGMEKTIRIPESLLIQNVVLSTRSRSVGVFHNYFFSSGKCWDQVSAPSIFFVGIERPFALTEK